MRKEPFQQIYITKALALALATVLLLTFVPAVQAAQPEKRLTDCLKRAAQSPDQAAAEAESWMKKAGGDKARLCRAYAQFHRGEFNVAGAEFAWLASKAGNKDKTYTASLHAKAGLAFSRANDHVNAEAQYTKALKLEPQDPEIWVDRAMERASIERYWDAIEDFNQALTLMPDMTEAIRMRGQAWVKLGQDRKAFEDFQRAQLLESRENSSPSP